MCMKQQIIMKNYLIILLCLNLVCEYVSHWNFTSPYVTRAEQSEAVSFSGPRQELDESLLACLKSLYNWLQRCTDTAKKRC